MTPFDKLHVALGDIRTENCLKKSDGTAIAGVCVSDVRFKKNIASLPLMLDRIVALRPVTYKWRSDEFPERHWGSQIDLGSELQKT